MSDDSNFSKRKEYGGQTPYMGRFGSANFRPGSRHGDSSLRTHEQQMSAELRKLRIIELEHQIELLRLQNARLEKERCIREARSASMMHGPLMHGRNLLNSGEYDLRLSHGHNSSAQLMRVHDGLLLDSQRSEQDRFLLNSNNSRDVRSWELGVAALPPIGAGTQEDIDVSSLSRNDELFVRSGLLRGVSRQDELMREHSKILDRGKSFANSHSARLAIASPRPNIGVPQRLSPLAGKSKSLQGTQGQYSAKSLQGTQGQYTTNREPLPSGSTEPGDTLTIPLVLPTDAKFLSPFQQLIRQSVELFQIQPDAMFTNVHGRTHKISPGQIGVRCRHCAHRPLHWRGRGSLYFPGTVGGVYQAAQNIANHHLMVTCPNIPVDIREALQNTRGKQSARKGGGKQYWIDGCRNLGLCDREDADGVWLKKEEERI